MKKLYLLLAALVIMLLSQPLAARPPGSVLPKADTWFQLSFTGKRTLMAATFSGEAVLGTTEDETSHWRLVPVGDKSYRILNRKTNQYLTAPASDAPYKKLTMVDKPRTGSDWYINTGSGMHAKYTFIRNKANNMSPVDDPDGSTSAVQRSVGVSDPGAKFFSWKLIEIGPVK